MLSFKEFLSEQIRFAVGKDDDFFYDRFKIIVFKKGDIKEYRVEGRTAGLWSHACKHLEEVEPEFVAQVISQVKQTIAEYIKSDNHPKDYEFRYFSTLTTSKTKDPLKILGSVPREAVVNFLDLVNDKIYTKKELAPIEKKMVKYLKALGNKYAQFIEKIMDKAESIESSRTTEQAKELIQNSDTISFRVIRKDHEMKMYIDFKHRFLIIRDMGGVHTGFQISDTLPNRKSVISTFMERFGRGLRFENINVYRAFKSFDK